MNIKNKSVKQSKKKQFYDIVLSRIIYCKYISNQIITEKELVAEFKVSKTPIREALLELCNEGYLQSIPRLGYQILNFSDYKQIKSINDYRICLEHGTIDFFWDRLDIKKIEKFEKYYLEELLTFDDSSILNCWDNNVKFHVELVSLFNNQYVVERLKKAMNYLKVAYAQSYWEYSYTDKVLEEQCHKKIIKYLYLSDKENVLKYLLEDISNFVLIDK